MNHCPSNVQCRLGRKVAVLVMLTVLVSVPLLGTGCGPATPQDVVMKFLTAIEEKNWYGYLSSILPENVRAVPGEEMNYRREAFEENQEDFEDIKMDVKPDEKNKDVASVILADGTVSRTNPESGEKETRSLKDFAEEQRTVMTKKYKGRWYVDIMLAAPVESEEVEIREGEVE